MTISACPACGHGGGEEFFAQVAVPVICNVLFHTAEEARLVPRGDVRLLVCPKCSMIWNSEYRDDVVEYGAHYENSLHFSPRFQAFASALADRLVDGIPSGGTVVEMGCGQGDFLDLLCRREDLQGVGLDPGYRGPIEPTARVRYLVGSWDDTPPDVHADLLCARHVLEHLSGPSDLLAASLRLMHRDGLLYIEVPNADYMLAEVALWDIIFEHPLYFGDRALRNLVEANGFDVLRSGTSFDDQYLWVEGRPGAGTERVADASVLEAAHAFGRRAGERLDQWSALLEHAEQQGRRTALWGLGSKGVSFLNLVASGSAVTAVVDVNPRKAGLHVPGTGHRIASPGELPALDIDDVLLLNPAYEAEVADELIRLGLDSPVLVAPA